MTSMLIVGRDQLRADVLLCHQYTTHVGELSPCKSMVGVWFASTLAGEDAGRGGIVVASDERVMAGARHSSSRAGFLVAQSVARIPSALALVTAWVRLLTPSLP